MSTPGDWTREYARQAKADLSTWNYLQDNEQVPECHKLLFLQMTCEKLCKAHLIRGGASPDSFQTSHGFVARPLPNIIRERLIALRKDLRRMGPVMRDVRHLAKEIEVLNPAIRRDGRRPDNCEYPWEDGNEILHSPLDWTFHPVQLLTAPAGRIFLKLLRLAIDNLL
jgi:hypothetical protein